jgi:hypothetical protein
MNEQYRKYRKEFEARFERYSKIAGSEQEFVSPSGLYKLEISKYGNGQETCWNYSRGIVSKIASGEILTDVKRNIGHFWHTWVEHPNGNEYLLCGEDYQGYSVVNLTQGTYQVYFPDEGYQGYGFCWAVVYPSPDKLMLAVDGCFWAAPYEIVFYDFRQPDNLPYKELGRVSELNDSEGWLNNETFVLTREIEIRKSDGVPYEELSEAEQEILDADSSLVDYKIEKINAKRPLLETVV